MSINDVTRNVYPNTNTIPANMYTRNRPKDFLG